MVRVIPTRSWPQIWDHIWYSMHQFWGQSWWATHILRYAQVSSKKSPIVKPIPNSQHHPYWSIKRKNGKCASHFHQSSGIARARSQNWRLSTDDKSSPSASALASLDAMDSSSAKLQIPWEKHSGKRWSTLEKPNLLGNPVFFPVSLFLATVRGQPTCFLVRQLPGPCFWCQWRSWSRTPSQTWLSSKSHLFFLNFLVTLLNQSSQCLVDSTNKPFKTFSEYQ